MEQYKLRTIIVEDNPEVLQYLQSHFESMPHIHLIGTATNLKSAKALLNQKIDLLIVDLGLPDGSGIELIRLVKSKPNTKVIVVTVFGDEVNVVNSIEAGADGYLLKDADHQTMTKALDDALNGIAPISPAIAGHLLHRIRQNKATVSQSSDAGEISLTPREVVILETLAKGFSYKEIAAIQNVSFHTVNEHLKAVYRKLAVNSRGEAVYEAMKTGLIDP